MARPSLFVVATVLTILGQAGPAAAQDQPAKKTAKGETKKGGSLFSAGAKVGKTLYISGKGDYKPNAAFPEKVENCLNEIRKTLRSAGLDMRHVVKSFVYLEDHEKYPELNATYAKFFPEDPPARTTLGVSQVPGPSRLEITCIAYTDLAEKKRVGDPPAGFPFSPGILAGDTLYISGKGDQIPGGGHPATFEEQVRQAMKNVEATLKQAGLDFRHVVMSHVFLDKYENLEVADKVYNEFFEDGSEPACATVFVDWIPGGSHVEITCIATTDLAGRKVVRPDRAQARVDRGRRRGQPGGLGREHPLHLRARRLAAAGRRGRGQPGRAGPPDGPESHRRARIGRPEPRGHRLGVRLPSRHEGLRADERGLPPVLLAGRRRPDVLDAQLVLREERRPRPRLVHRGATAVALARGRLRRLNPTIRPVPRPDQAGPVPSRPDFIAPSLRRSRAEIPPGDMSPSAGDVRSIFLEGVEASHTPFERPGVTPRRSRMAVDCEDAPGLPPVEVPPPRLTGCRAAP